MKATTLTRRRFLAASAAFPFALRSVAESPAPHWVLLGTDKGQGIYRARWDAAKGELGKVELAVATDRPNYFAMHPALPVLYTVNEMDEAKAGVSGFRVDAKHGKLTLINEVSSRADGPCFMSVEKTGKSAFVADYAGGTVAAYNLDAQGKLQETPGVFDCRNNSACGTLAPASDREIVSHMHCTVISPDNKFMLACDLGEDVINVFPIAPGAENPLGKPMRIAARATSGPRHLAFHPNGKWLYCMHELDCSIDVYDWSVNADQASLTLRPGSTISTLAAGASLTGNSGCEIVMGDDGRFVYACSRGVNELIVYRVNETTGLLTEQQRLSCGGPIPRYIAFDPSRKWLLSCNQGGAGSVTVFAHDAATGRLEEKPKTFAVNTAMFVAWI